MEEFDSNQPLLVKGIKTPFGSLFLMVEWFPPSPLPPPRKLQITTSVHKLYLHVSFFYILTIITPSNADLQRGLMSVINQDLHLSP